MAKQQDKEYAKLLQVVNNSKKMKKQHLVQFLSVNLCKSIVECRQSLNVCEQLGYVVADNKGTHHAITYRVTDSGNSFIKSVMPKQVQQEETEGLRVALSMTERECNNKSIVINENNNNINQNVCLNELKLQIDELRKGQLRLISIFEQTIGQVPMRSSIKNEDIVNNKSAFGYIYGTFDLLTHKMYIGQSTKLDKYSLENYKGSGIYISKELKERPQDFQKRILRVCYNQQELDKWEIILIEYYNSRNPLNGYNEQIGGTDRVESIHFSKQIGVDVNDFNAIKQIHKEQTCKEKQYRNLK